MASRQVPNLAEDSNNGARRRRRLPRGVVLSVIGSVVILGVLELVAIRMIDHNATTVALDEAGRFATESVEVALAPYLTDELAAGDPDAIAAISVAGDSLIDQSALTHVKIWSEDGTVLWSDEPDLIGRQFELDPDDRELFASQGVTVAVSPLEEAENQLEAADEDQLVEVYAGTTTTTGTPLLLEIYAPYELIPQRASALRRQFMPAMTAALVALAVAQLLLVLFLGRRLNRAERRHTDLLERMLEMSDAERRRVAAQVHDGVVQDLIGVSFGLAALAESTPEQAEPLSELATSTRHSVAALRSLLGSIYPVEVPPGGWVVGIDDLVTALSQLGVDVRIDVDDVRMSKTEEVLILRVAREALRNIASHAHASHVVIQLTERRGRLVLTVGDDGTGFEPSSQPKDGHFGLRLIHDVIHEAGGDLTIESTSDDGTTVTVELEMAH